MQSARVEVEVSRGGHLDPELVAQLLLGLAVRKGQGEPRHGDQVALERRLIAVRPNSKTKLAMKKPDKEAR